MGNNNNNPVVGCLQIISGLCGIAAAILYLITLFD